MVRVTAFPIITTMKNLQTLRYRPFVDDPGKAVGCDLYGFNVDAGIPVAVNGSQPSPTSVRLDHISPKVHLWRNLQRSVIPSALARTIDGLAAFVADVLLAVKTTAIYSVRRHCGTCTFTLPSGDGVYGAVSTTILQEFS
jgi:hypothetical protein